jgi:hypothetical protein
MARNGKRRLVVLGVLAAASLVGLLALTVRAVQLSPAWMRASAASPLGVRCLVIIGVGMLALGAAAMVLVRARGPAGRRRAVGRKGIATDQGGTAAIEMTLLLPFALMIFLVIAQAAILFNGNMVVHYSGFAASRVAIVVVPMEIGDELKNLVYNPDWAGNPPSEKLELIRRAAVLALVPVSGPLEEAETEAEAVPGAGGGQAVEGQTRTLFGFFGSDDPWWFKRIRRQYNYANKYTKLTLARPEHWRDGNPDPDCPYRHQRQDAWSQWGWSYVPYCPFHPERMDYGYWEDLHLRIVYPFLLEVPVANRVMGGEKFDLPGRQGNSYATEIKVISTLSNEGGPEVRPKDG